MSLPHVTFDLYHAPALAWQKPPNTIEDPDGIAGTDWLKGWWRCCCSTLAGSRLGGGGGRGVGGMALFVDFWWPV